MKMFGKKKSPATYDEKYLLQELMMTKKAMYTAYSNLDNVTDPDLIDCYIYQLNSEQKRYNYLLAKAKESSALMGRTRGLALAVLSAAGMSGCAVHVYPSSGYYQQPRVVETVYVSSPVVSERRHVIVI